jgi:hypothetical protein
VFHEPDLEDSAGLVENAGEEEGGSGYQQCGFGSEEQHAGPARKGLLLIDCPVCSISRFIKLDEYRMFVI